MVTGALLLAGAAFATGGIVARLIAVNAARRRYFIGVLHLWTSRARCPASAAHMEVTGRQDNARRLDWIYALADEILDPAPERRQRGGVTLGRGTAAPNETDEDGSPGLDWMQWVLGNWSTAGEATVISVWRDWHGGCKTDAA
jgi:hypothetical protein